MSIKTLKSTQQDFPERLKQLYSVPKEIYTIGADIDSLLSLPTLGVVGSRKVSAYGRATTLDLVNSASKSEIVIVSGLALGVDSIAHQASLKANGKTIAVLPSGIKKIYPASHTGLARNIVQKGGALVTEYSDNAPPMKHQFIERNRIIAALSDALLITEAAEKSGSLHTARFALELGKPVLAVPGNISSPTSIGTNNLLKMGATPVTSPQDILDALGIIKDPQKDEQIIYGDNEHESTILKLLQQGLSSGSELLDASALDTIIFQQHMTMLEIKGHIKPLGNDKWGLA